MNKLLLALLVLATPAGAQPVKPPIPANNGPTTGAQLASILTTPLPEVAVPVTIASNILTINLNAGTWFSWSNNANIATLAIQNASSAVRTFVLVPVGNGSAFTQAGFSTLKWAGGVQPTVTTTNGAWDVYVCTNVTGTTTFSCVISGQGFGP